MLGTIKTYALAIASGLAVVFYFLFQVKAKKVKEQKHTIKVIGAEREMSDQQREFKAKVVADEVDEITREVENAKTKSKLDMLNHIDD